MAYPNLEFISMQEAANDPKLDISTEKLRLYSEEGLLPIYIKGPSPRDLYYSKEDGPPHRYAKVIAPLWDGDTLIFENSAAEIMGRTEKPFEPKQITYAAGFSYANVMIKPSELLKLKEVKTCQNIGTKPAQEQSSRVTTPNVTGRKGAIKTMIFGGLQAFYDQKKRLPEEGNAFQEFLDFIYIQINQKTRPDYLTYIVKFEKTGTETSNCITIKGGKKPKNRKYISTQFYKFKKEFTPQVAMKESVDP